jgi:hypothetical protein
MKIAVDQAFARYVGLQFGQRTRAFALSDQLGHQRSGETLKARYFFFSRSGNWRPFCKAKPVQLQNAKQRFAARGLKRAVRHDSRLMWVANSHSYDFCVHYTSPA